MPRNSRHTGASRIVTALLSTAVSVLPSSGQAQTGKLLQLPATDACWNEDGSSSCSDGIGLRWTTGAAISPDGANLYTCGFDAVAAFSRDRDTGALAQLTGMAACYGDPYACTDAVYLGNIDSIEISPDGRNVYVSSYNYDTISSFYREPSTGALRQQPASTNCISETDPSCTLGRSLSMARGMAISARGEHVYLAAAGDDSIGVFIRDEVTGDLAQAPGFEGCIREGGGQSCATGRSLVDPADITVSKDGRNAYSTSIVGDSVAVFTRDRTTGALSQAAGTEGCLSLSGAGTCTASAGLDGASGVAVSRDGRHVYVSSTIDSAVTAFSRDRRSGALTFLSCVSAAGTAPCTAGTALAGASDVRLTRDGKTVYVVAEQGHSIAVFARDKKTGLLEQLPALDGCLTADASGPCTLGRAITYPGPVAIDRRGESVYVPSSGVHGVAVFERLRK